MSIIESQYLRVIRDSTHQKLHLVQRCVLKLQLRKTPTRLYIYTNRSKTVKCPISTICKVMVWVQMIRILPCPSVYCIGYWPALPSIPLVQRLGGPLLLLSLSVCLFVIFFLFSNVQQWVARDILCHLFLYWSKFDLCRGLDFIIFLCIIFTYCLILILQLPQCTLSWLVKFSYWF